MECSLANFKGRTVINERRSKKFDVSFGVKQGNPLSAVILNLSLYYDASNIDFEGNIFCKMKQVGAYADDVVIVASDKNILKELYLELKKKCSRYGPNCELQKTKYMKASAAEKRRTLEV